MSEKAVISNRSTANLNGSDITLKSFLYYTLSGLTNFTLFSADFRKIRIRLANIGLDLYSSKRGVKKTVFQV